MKNQFVIMRGTQDNDSSFLVRCAVSTGKTVTDVSSHRNASIFTVKHQQSTRHNLPDDFNLQHHHCDNLKSRTNTGRSNELPVRYCHTIGGAKKKRKKSRLKPNDREPSCTLWYCLKPVSKLPNSLTYAQIVFPCTAPNIHNFENISDER